MYLWMTCWITVRLLRAVIRQTLLISEALGLWQIWSRKLSARQDRWTFLFAPQRGTSPN